MTVYRLLHAAELRCVRVGDQFRIDALDLEAYLYGASADFDYEERSDG